MRTTALTISADKQLLDSAAALAAAALPPTGFVLPKAARSRARAGVSRRGVGTPKPASKRTPPVTLTIAVIAFEDTRIGYTTWVEVPAAFRRQAATGPAAQLGGVNCSLHFCLNRLAAAVRPEAMQADLELADTHLVYAEKGSEQGMKG